ncbi:hypothetical protein GOODEAATRI_033281 [Goodea atripinnis]|uniref:Uncharacterized protein n=1 Tax=Goodea atripinnis TaxID=208336 RepID=A0ABV0MMQ0_9TELE
MEIQANVLDGKSWFLIRTQLSVVSEENLSVWIKEPCKLDIEARTVKRTSLNSKNMTNSFHLMFLCRTSHRVLQNWHLMWKHLNKSCTRFWIIQEPTYGSKVGVSNSSPQEPLFYHVYMLFHSWFIMSSGSAEA